HLQQANQTSFEGDNYISLIPLVTNENGARTNVGLNNFSRFSVRKKADPVASVLVQLRDPSGKLDREGVFSVRSNEMRQINRVMTALPPVDGGGAATTGWLLIWSDEPITAWASVILDRVNNDPAVELAIADQIYKQAAYVESTGTPSNPLLIQSSVKAGSFKSRLAVVNIGSGPGRLRIKLFDRTGRPQRPLPPVDVGKFGMYVDNDIRSTVPETWGQIIIEVEDLLPERDDREPLIIATSLVESTTGPFAGFFPAFAMPRSNTPAIAGIWEGPVTGEIMNAQVRVTLYQERDMLYGLLEILSGTFPTVNRHFLIRGAVSNGTYELEVRDFFDDCPRRGAPCVFFGYRMFALSLKGNTMNGDTIYFDENNRFDRGNFRLTRVGAIYPPPE
ncbi:MAG: hypothetical protein OXI92_09315, partial [Acidobacteriota bacterium]|nr:hypothetical protein [Acidobacteriota bacterium]